ncbi:MAG: hypothetical protein H7296_06770 [Bacteroidia bacterium]|nr:hypothetical protein [Bacteroidia bacterium]
MGIILLFSRCTKESDCDNHLLGSISEIEYKDSLKLGMSLTYQLKIKGFSNCSSVESVIGKQTGNTIYIKANIFNRGCKCDQSLPTFNGSYIFKPDTAGTYYLSFLNDLPAKYITDMVVVFK